MEKKPENGTNSDVSENGSSLDRLHAKELENIFVTRFQTNFKEFRNFGRIFHPLEGKAYPATSSDKEPVQSNKNLQVIQIMKKHKIFDRSVLDEMPVNQICRYEIYSRSFFGKKLLKIVVAALCLSPLESLVTGGSPRKLGLMEVEKAIKSLVRESGVFYYMGIASTSGWEGAIREQLPKGMNWLVGIVENLQSTEWSMFFPDRDNWNNMENVFDPETEGEKIARCKIFLQEHRDLRLRGGHLPLDDLSQDLNLPDYLLVAAIEDLLAEDQQLEVREVAGKKILKRKRL